MKNQNLAETTHADTIIKQTSDCLELSSISDPTNYVRNEVDWIEHVNDGNLENCSFPVEESENTLGLTKSGNPRKRRKKRIRMESKEEIKKKKIEDLANKHQVLPGCCPNKCKKKCFTKINEERRVAINEEYWKLTWLERRNFILQNCQRLKVGRRTTTTGAENLLRNNSFKYFLRDSTGVINNVCKVFFLTTLGYKRNNDRAIHDVLTKRADNLHLTGDKRGKHPSVNKISDVEFTEHVESFNPTDSHYHREHVPNFRYLPSDITITFMHENFLKKYPNIKISYETYRQKLGKMKISFTRLGHEECSVCEALKSHEHNKDNLQEDCEICKTWKCHNDMYTKSRDLYRKHAENIQKGSKAAHFSADLEKVIMLPRVNTFKEVIFTERLTVYNKCFVPLEEKSQTPSFAVVWHEGIAGRSKEELISAFHAYLINQRDSESLEIWLDNCSDQNKNWCLLSFLVFIINSDLITCKEIIINYYEPCHTFTSVDSFHHQIELSLKRMGNVYDLNDFCTAVQCSNKGNVVTKVMDYGDFHNWIDYSSAVKLKHPDRPRLADIVCLKAVRGAYILKYKSTYEESDEYKDLNFLKASAMKKDGMLYPRPKSHDDGFPKEKKENILHSLRNILPQDKKEFWKNLPEPSEEPVAKK